MSLLERLGFSFRRNSAQHDDAGLQTYSEIESASALGTTRHVLAGPDYHVELPACHDDRRVGRHVSDHLSIWNIY